MVYILEEDDSKYKGVIVSTGKRTVEVKLRKEGQAWIRK